MDSETGRFNGEHLQSSTEQEQHDAQHNMIFATQTYWIKTGAVLTATMFAFACINALGRGDVQRAHLGEIRRLSYPVNGPVVSPDNVSVDAIRPAAVEDSLNASADILVQQAGVERFCIFNDAHGDLQFAILSLKSFRSYLSLKFPRGSRRCIHGSRIGATRGEPLRCTHFFNQFGYLCPGRGYSYRRGSRLQVSYRCSGNKSPIKCVARGTSRF